MKSLEPRPKGAAGHVLALLIEKADPEGRVTMSLLDLAVESGYTVQTIQTAVRNLEANRYVFRHQPDPRRATCYELVPGQLRRAIIAGELVGLLQPLGVGV